MRNGAKSSTRVVPRVTQWGISLVELEVTILGFSLGIKGSKYMQLPTYVASFKDVVNAFGGVLGVGSRAHRKYLVPNKRVVVCDVRWLNAWKV